MTNNNMNSAASATFIPRSTHKANFENLVSTMRAYANAINTGNDGETFRADMALQGAAADFLRPYGYAAGAAFMAMLRADVSFKKDKETGERVFGIPSGATIRKYLRVDIFPRIGLVWESCVKSGEKQVKAKKAEKVDFGSMSVSDIINGMSAEKFAEFAAAFAARQNAAAEIAAD